jgi:uncharacterized protein (TIGR00255 family)
MNEATGLNHPVRSMTGYARVRRETPLGELTVSLRSVNHRGLDFHFFLSGEFAAFENAVRATLKRDISRGHIEVRISLTRIDETVRAGYNRRLIADYVAAFREAAAEFGLQGQPDLNAAFRMPGAFAAESEVNCIDNAFEPEVMAALAACVAELNAFREREGAQLRELFRAEVEAIRRQTRRMKEIRTEALPHFQRRLTERLHELLGSTGIEPRRLAEEAALLTDRSDVEEELSRLEIHTAQLTELLDAGGEVGKRVDFLLQEMNRETNTVLSKTSGIGETGLLLTDLALATKANIEKVREQSLNLE